MGDEYEVERTVSREEAATILHGIADGVAAGAVRLGDGDDERTVEIPGQFELEVEFETGEGDEVSLEVELGWPEGEREAAGETGDSDETSIEEAGPDVEEPEADEGSDDPVAEGGPESIAEPALGAAARQVSLGRFELFEDRGGEWRWRLVHRNGNVVATSGEGYTRKHNARKGLRSVLRNAEGAAVTERTEE